MIRSEQIFRRDAKGKNRFWFYEVDGDKWRGVGGLIDGKPTAAKWTVAKPKNVGRKNETTPEQQAAFEAAAEFAKKLDREYRRKIEELEFVPPAPMLARNYKDELPIQFPCFSQPKLDGIRALGRRTGGTSREYQPHHNIEHIMEALEPVFRHYRDIALDGELYNHTLKDDFNTISSVVRTQNVTDEDRARARDLIQFHVYDILNPKVPFSHRHLELTRIFEDVIPPGSPIVLVPTTRVMDQAGLDDLYFNQYLPNGYEGQMVRYDGLYENDRRSKFLLKRKERATAEFILLSVEEGVGNWAGLAKAVTFAVPGDWPASCETMKGVWADKKVCGAGIRGTEEQMRKLLADSRTWDIESRCPLVTVEFSPPTPDGYPRFPVAIDFHPNGRRD